MLNVEMLICEVPKYHKNCRWVHARIRYPDERYSMLKRRLASEVLKTGTAYRITHWKFGVLTTIKLGHDNQLFVQDNEEVLREFAIF